MNNIEIIRKFYDSFINGNAEAMVDCYDQNIIFSDPAFGELKGEDAKNMWRMLIGRSNGNLKISYDNVVANDKKGSANWTAEYVFSQTGRKVINKIAASFEFENGKIIKHSDHFNLWKWSRQALGLKGLLLGWSLFMKSKIQQQTNHLLNSYTKKTTADKN
ncbi:MAG: nuclear transport factor 2 family protein [Bacteroidales bacterium]